METINTILNRVPLSPLVLPIFENNFVTCKAKYLVLKVVISSLYTHGERKKAKVFCSCFYSPCNKIVLLKMCFYLFFKRKHLRFNSYCLICKCIKWRSLQQQKVDGFCFLCHYHVCCCLYFIQKSKTFQRKTIVCFFKEGKKLLL